MSREYELPAAQVIGTGSIKSSARQGLHDNVMAVFRATKPYTRKTLASTGSLAAGAADRPREAHCADAAARATFNLVRLGTLNCWWEAGHT